MLRSLSDFHSFALHPECERYMVDFGRIFTIMNDGSLQPIYLLLNKKGIIMKKTLLALLIGSTLSFSATAATSYAVDPGIPFRVLRSIIWDFQFNEVVLIRLTAKCCLTLNRQREVFKSLSKQLRSAPNLLNWKSIYAARIFLMLNVTHKLLRLEQAQL